MALDQRGSDSITDRYFDENAEAFLDLEWDPGRQVLSPRRRIASIVNPKAMNLRVNPMEGRHESIIRPMLTMIAGLRRRVRELEATLETRGLTRAEPPTEPQDERSEGSTSKSTSDPESLADGRARSLAESIDAEIVEKFGG